MQKDAYLVSWLYFVNEKCVSAQECSFNFCFNILGNWVGPEAHQTASHLDCATSISC